LISRYAEFAVLEDFQEYQRDIDMMLWTFLGYCFAVELFEELFG